MFNISFFVDPDENFKIQNLNRGKVFLHFAEPLVWRKILAGTLQEFPSLSFSLLVFSRIDSPRPLGVILTAD